ncbi:iron-containing redox enzyme family protein [Sphingomonas sp.]|uniref:iron-containing redox enzyme family protein n=1 Tax=Sphingomonas sp. TaxID=28214 RepID=UPI003AFFFC46
MLQLVQPTASGTQDLLADTTQRSLARWNAARLAPGVPTADWRAGLDRDARMMRVEGEFLEQLRAEVADEAAAAPTDVDGFVAWFEALEPTGPGQHDALFPWLAEEATLAQFRWFFEQEAAGEAGFDDLVAMTQIKLPTAPKLELARNYWDEMGRGNPKGMHGPMLDALVETLQVDPSIDRTVAESLTLANAMTAMAANRRYAWHSVGALGVIELTAPARASLVEQGLRRLGFSGKERKYFALHSVLDIKHSEDWIAEALRPAMAEDPTRGRWLAEGALIRLKCGARCFARYRAELWGGAVAGWKRAFAF